MLFAFMGGSGTWNSALGASFDKKGRNFLKAVLDGGVLISARDLPSFSAATAASNALS